MDADQSGQTAGEACHYETIIEEGGRWQYRQIDRDAQGGQTTTVMTADEVWTFYQNEEAGQEFAFPNWVRRPQPAPAPVMDLRTLAWPNMTYDWDLGDSYLQVCDSIEDTIFSGGLQEGSRAWFQDWRDWGMEMALAPPRYEGMGDLSLDPARRLTGAGAAVLGQAGLTLFSGPLYMDEANSYYAGMAHDGQNLGWPMGYDKIIMGHMMTALTGPFTSDNIGATLALAVLLMGVGHLVAGAWPSLSLGVRQILAGGFGGGSGLLGGKGLFEGWTGTSWIEAIFSGKGVGQPLDVKGRAAGWLAFALSLMAVGGLAYMGLKGPNITSSTGAAVAEDAAVTEVVTKTSTGERITYDPQPKGDYAAGYEAILPPDGRTATQKAADAGFVKQGNKLVKSYGPRSPPDQTVAGTFTVSDPAVFQARVSEVGGAKTGSELILHPFSGGGTHITTSARLAAHAESATFGGPSGLFLAPTRQVDALLASGASRSQIEIALGLNEGALSQGALMRIDVANPFARNLSLPTSGNMFFQPGGLTWGGLNEGIISSPLKTDPGVILCPIP